jgi:GH18 family chitinase
MYPSVDMLQRFRFVPILGLLTSGCLAGTAYQSTLRPSKSRKIIGYYADWTATKYPLAGIPADKLTQVTYAFGKIGPDNRLTWNVSIANEQVYPGDCAAAGCQDGRRL